jgi:hypothetical protein
MIVSAEFKGTIMPRGGKRTGAGRPVGSKTKTVIAELFSGVAEGVEIPTRGYSKMQMREFTRSRVVNGQIADPLEVLCKFAMDQRLAANLRIQAAGVACKYLHPALSAVAVQHTDMNGSDRHAQSMNVVQRLEHLLESSAVVQNFAEASIAVDVTQLLLNPDQGR